MAGLVLGMAGQYVGSFFGPLGAAIGQLVGSAIGNALFPQKVEGPRLTDLKLQSAQYGEFITVFWGTQRFAGKIIWQTDLIEHKHKSGGKGGPEITEYSYTCSFAIALADRYGMSPLAGVPKIWADGRLIHDTTSYASESAITFKMYPGDEEQLPDPTIELDKGAGNVPAHRGTAYLVFTDLDMGEFGNRIPNFSFLCTDQAPVDVHLHIVKQNTEPLEPTWYEDWGSTGIGHPYIIDWPADGPAVVKNLGQSGVHHYDTATMTYIGEGAKYPGPGTPGLPDLVTMRLDNPYTIFRTGWYCGLWRYNDSEVHVYCDVLVPIQSGTINAALFGDSFHNVDDLVTQCAIELAASAGVPEGDYIKSVVFTQDRRGLFIFTSPSSGSAPLENWYKLVDGAVEASGTVDIAGAGGQFDQNYFGNAGGGYKVGYGCAQFENNGKWMWSMYGAGSPNVVDSYYIDDANVFRFNTVGGQAGGLDLRTGSPPVNYLYTSLSIEVINEGFVGVVGGDFLAVISRFPVYAPEGIPLSDLVEDICLRTGLAQEEVNVTSLADDRVPGYMLAQQNTGRAAIGPLQSAYMFDAVESDATMKFVKRGSAPVLTIPDDDLAAAPYGSAAPDHLAVTRVPEEELPQQVNVDFTNLEEDYQQGHAYDSRQVTSSRMQQTLGVAIAMQPTRARNIAQQLLYNQWIEREKFTLSLPSKYAYLEPTDVITVMGRSLRLTKQDQSQEGVIKFEGVAAPHARTWVGAAVGVSGSGFVPQVPPVKQATEMVMLDIPMTNSAQHEPGFQLAVAGYESPAWRGAGIFRSTDNVTYDQVSDEITADIIGVAGTILGPGLCGNVFDDISTVTVYLSPGAPSGLESRTATEVLNGANECVIGAEVLQYRNATLISTRVYELSGLLRGRYGSEWAAEQHIAGETFVKLPAKDYAMPLSELGADRYYKAVTTGSTLASAEPVPFRNTGVRVKPLSPVFVGGGSDASGNVTINWTRRSRIPASWQAPLGETSESYVLQIWNSTYTQVARKVVGQVVPSYVYTAAMQTADFGALQLQVFVTVAQSGTYLYGYEARATIPGGGGSNANPIVPVLPYNPPTPVVPGSSTANHFDNFETLFYGDSREYLLAYHYLHVDPAAVMFHQQNQFEIIERYFNNSHAAYANWAQQGTYNIVPTTAEFGMMKSMSLAAEA